jgi:hypothetical protein
MMSDTGLKRARELTAKGFHYENLVEMASHCREEPRSEAIVSAYILNRVFSEMAEEVGDGPVLISELRKLEAKYRTALNLALEAAAAGASQDEQNRRLAELIRIRWHSKAVQ